MKSSYRLIALILLASAFITRPPAHAQNGAPVTYGNIEWSPDGTKIAYEVISENDEEFTIEYNIWVYDFETGESQNLTANGAGIDEYPQWSPDGTKIAFASSRDMPEPDADFATTDVWLMDADGANPVKLTKTSDVSYIPASFSPDGRYLTVIAQPDFEAEQPNVWVGILNLEDLTISRISPADKGDYFSEGFSPDGRKFLLISFGDDKLGLWLVEFENGQITPAKPILPEGDVTIFHDWSPDSCCFVFPQRGTSDELHLAVMNVETGETTPLTDGFEGNQNNPAWSPDGGQILYTEISTETNPQATFTAGDAGQIWVMDADGSNPTVLTSSIEGYQGYGVWSPDGTRIAFINVHYAEDGSLLTSDIWVINADGSNPQNLTGNFQ